MRKIWRDYTFEAAHRLPNLPAEHKCSRLHGHTYYVRVTVQGEVDSMLGWVMDYAHLDGCWDVVYDLLDHRYLNEIEGLSNPTTEVLQPWIAVRISLALPSRVELVEVRVKEGADGGGCA